jgi:hypothetical protein
MSQFLSTRVLLVLIGAAMIFARWTAASPQASPPVAARASPTPPAAGLASSRGAAAHCLLPRQGNSGTRGQVV